MYDLFCENAGNETSALGDPTSQESHTQFAELLSIVRHHQRSRDALRFLLSTIRVLLCLAKHR